jgi:hypothetical protein
VPPDEGEPPPQPQPTPPPIGPPPLPPVLPPPYLGQPVPPPGARSPALVVSVIAVVAGIAIIVMLLAGGIVLLRGKIGTFGGADPITATSKLPAGRGVIVFADNFHDSSSGWYTGTTNGTTYSYSAGGYQVLANTSLYHLIPSPYERPLDQLSIAVTATQSADSPPGAGFGVVCEQGPDATNVRYEFVVESPGDWYVSRGDGPSGPTANVKVLRQGSTTFSPSTTPLTVEGMCATLSGGTVVRLALFVGGSQIADFTDTVDRLPGSGWQSDFVVSSDATSQSTVTATLFLVRDISH